MAETVDNVPIEDKQTIRKTFPLIVQIKDAKLREGVVKAWYIAWKESSFKNLGDAPFVFTPAQGDTLVKHTNTVASAALAMGRLLIQQYNVKINLDYVIAGAILHDLDKIVIYERKGIKTVRSELGEKIVHGAYGGHIALLAGVPQDIVFIIMAHSPFVDVELPSIEGKVITMCDHSIYKTLYPASSKK